jgi:hypothetical protein
MSCALHPSGINNCNGCGVREPGTVEDSSGISTTMFKHPTVVHVFVRKVVHGLAGCADQNPDDSVQRHERKHKRVTAIFHDDPPAGSSTYGVMREMDEASLPVPDEYTTYRYERSGMHGCAHPDRRIIHHQDRLTGSTARDKTLMDQTGGIVCQEPIHCSGEGYPYSRPVLC